MRRSDEITRLWARTFGETHVITMWGHEARVDRLVATVPFDPSLLIIDYDRPGYDCLTEAPEANHHVVVGNRHKRVVERARRRGLKNVFVFEDDAEFVDGDDDTLRRVLRWVDENQNRWDIFYFGFLAPLLSTSSFVTRSVVEPRRPFHAHALCYSAGIYDRIESIDFRVDHRPPFYRIMERTFSSGQRSDAYFRDGVGSIDTWLSFSGARRFAAHPILVVQTSLPPGTEDNWARWTGRPYDARRTPGTLAGLALGVHYLKLGLTAVALLGLLLWMYKC